MKIYCTFCARESAEVTVLVKGDGGAAICDVCARLAYFAVAKFIGIADAAEGRREEVIQWRYLAP